MGTTPRIVAQFAKRVRELRDRKGISQERLSELAGLHRTYIGMIERAEKNITLVNLEKVARALGVKPSFLLD
jgi:transcriptional regulator with XRE-family HTH domain